MTQLVGGNVGGRNALSVSPKGFASGVSVSIPFSGYCSSINRLFSIGTGSIAPTAGALREVLWMRCDDNENDYYVTDIIYGWNGGDNNHNRTIFSLVSYNQTIPTGDATLTNAGSENIKTASETEATSLNNFTGYIWDGTGTGMTGMTGGFGKIGNRLAQGNDSLNIDEEIIIGKGKSLGISVNPEENGLFNVSVVFAVVPIGGFRELF